MPRKKRKTLKSIIPKLTKMEKNLLIYPPTKSSWYCKNKECKMINSGSSDRCWLCSVPKPDKPKLVWKDYKVACEKVEILPGEQLWKVSDGLPMVRTLGSRNGWEPWPKWIEFQKEMNAS
jgi:hypothetical protein